MIKQKIGRYEIVSEIGQGAMGVVYRALDPLLERTVAIKTISLELSKDEFEEFEQRFYREASSAGRLNHPNIVTVHDVGNTDHIAYMAMEFLEGVELRDIMDGGAQLDLDRIVEIASQVADGLAFAHEHGVVHRDIKPSNIMILKNGVAKITDFGIALIPSSSRTMAGMVLGSPKYMSPEQVVGQDVDSRSDIFSLGVMLYEMLTGKPPFSGENISVIMYRILNEMPVAPVTLKPDLPEVFNYIVAKALAKHPDDRYQNAAEMAEDLRNNRTLHTPLNFHAGSDGKPRTLERRSKPRSLDEQTLLMAAGVSPSSEFVRPWWKRPLVLAVGAIFLVLGFFLLSSEKPALQDQTPGVNANLEVESEKPDAPLLSILSTPQGTVALAVTPWGEIFVDGKREGVSPPLNELKLPVGKHIIEIRNPGFTTYSQVLDVESEATQKIKHKFK
ncbi:MAG: protein kinase [Gammaproteobacteria bacterium]|nr:protein kinase [Gammaproteobacteria bacterium]MBU1731939.1 protein kinase [Gammaproteobacteria bacterium]MBU1893077.1 protein kinase [Gammaproteobacteria bacterium]